MCVCLHSHSVVCWLIYHFDYWPLYALAKICWSSDAVWFLVNRAPKSLKPHDRPAKEKTKRQSHGRIKLKAASFFLYDRMQITQLWTPTFLSHQQRRTRAKCSTREKKQKHTHTYNVPNDWYLISGCDFKAKFLEFYEIQRLICIYLARWTRLFIFAVSLSSKWTFTRTNLEHFNDEDLEHFRFQANFT